MNRRLLFAAAISAAVVSGHAAAAAKQIAGVQCESPPPLHCPAENCPADLIANMGNAVDAKTGRKFFLDYPCDLKANEKVTFVLNLHGGGSIGNWQRHYFPIMDLKEKYRLVIATPSGVIRAWTPDDDAHLSNIVDYVYEQFGKNNIKAFWLAGHSQGGQTSNRLINNNFYRDRLTGWVSLSGGRLGSKRADIRAPIPASPPVPGVTPPPAPAGAAPQEMRLAADASVLPEYPFSHIYETGEHELTAAGLPKESKWAQKLGCGAQTRSTDVVDTKAGYINDTRPQPNANKIWGLKARPGTAQVYLYPNCKDGRVVADIVRLDKGHTEGLEPNITEAIVKLMMSATQK